MTEVNPYNIGNLIEPGHVVRINTPDWAYTNHIVPVGEYVGAEPKGLRYDAGKPRVDLIDPDFLLQVGAVLEAGARKYAERNWEKGMDWNKVYASMLRHMLKWQAGETNDDETGLHHMAHVACNAMFLLNYYNKDVGFDNRPK